MVYTTLNASLGLSPTPTNPANSVVVQEGTPSDITSLPVETQNAVITTGAAPSSLPVETVPSAFSNQSLTSQLAQVATKGKDMLVTIPISATATHLPAYTDSNAAVKGIIVYNPSGNSNPIAINGISVPVGGSFTWTVDEPNTSIDPTTISINTGGQPVTVNYIVRNT